MDKPAPAEGLEQALARITEQELSRNERYGHLVLALVGATFAIALVGLIVTEPGLSLRTMLSFGVLIAIGLAWTGYSLAMLMRRQPMLANREVIAGRMSVLFSLVFTAGAMFVGHAVGHNAFTGATWDGITLTAIAAALLLRAKLRLSSLRALRARLESELLARRV
jgi:hypothetical protein